MANAVGTCGQCGWTHAHVADVEACNAIHGHPREWPLEVRNPEVICRLCGLMAPMSAIVVHFHVHHAHDIIRTGRLVTFLTETSDVATYATDLEVEP